MEVLRLPDLAAHAITIRAKALTFEDPKSKVMVERIRLIAPSDANVLITGESGTGKELIARLIHNLSDRKDRPFIAINCGAFSEALIESELFGHERGAFTGAIGSRPGWFETASGGSLFLDEIGDVPLSVQVKLLRVLQEREVVRVGSRTPQKIDVRLIAATNVNLEEAVRAGHFREDLYYRLNVAKLSLLPLRERPGDILPLTRHFIEVYAQRLRIALPLLTEAARNKLLQHPWPGNIRELENVIHQALLVSTEQRLDVADLQFSSLGLFATAAAAPLPAQGVESALEAALVELFEADTPNLWQHIEEAVYRTAYSYCKGNQLQTSRLLNLSRNIVRARLSQLGILKLREAAEAEERRVA